MILEKNSEQYFGFLNWEFELIKLLVVFSNTYFEESIKPYPIPYQVV